MKPTRPSFTLVEATITLTIVAGLLLLGLQVGKHRAGPNLGQWQATFASYWQATRATSQQAQQRQDIVFNEHAVTFGGQSLAYPAGFVHSGQERLVVLPTGYMAPVTIKLSDGKQTLSIIVSLGGGDYRMVTS